MTMSMTPARAAGRGMSWAVCAAVGALALASPAAATTLSGNLTADDSFAVFLSASPTALGTELTSGASWGGVFSLPATALTAGKTYYLQIEAFDGPAPGAFIGTFGLSDANFEFANGSQSLNTDTSGWAGGFNDSTTGSVQPWVEPTGGVAAYGPNGIGPWGGHGGIDGWAYWIWPNDANSGGTNSCGSCTVDFMTTITPLTSGGVPEPSSWAVMVLGAAGLGAALRRRRQSLAAG